MILAVASGKGGTGKTTISANLAKVIGSGVQLLDCDVEEPNAHLFLKGSIVEQEIIGIPVPEVNTSLCDGCGDCSKFCVYHAIACPGATALVFPNLCHGCGGCARVCPSGAIHEVDYRIGVIETIETGQIMLTMGRLDIGIAMAPPLIRAVKRRVRADLDVILDAPPGTSCPVITTIQGAEAVLLVTEPTPFGLHDLKLAVEMIRALALPCGVVINRVGIGDDRVKVYCRQEAIPILAEIPNDRRIAEAYSRGELLIDALPEYHELFQNLVDKTRQMFLAEADL